MKHVMPISRGNTLPGVAVNLDSASNILQLTIDIVTAWITKKSAITPSA